jgi:phage minor structural protein
LIYLTNGNTPLNAAYADEIVQIDSNTYQLAFRFPTSDPLWERLKEETFLTADDLHGEQDFVIFEVEKKHGYVQVYANQVFTLLNNYVVNPISLDRQTGSNALSRFAGSITRSHPFSFFSDIGERHTFNIDAKNAMEAFAKDKHSILGQWGGDLVRHGYQVRLLKNGGSENESLFMYKKNLSSYQHKTSTKSLKTRITFKTTVKGEGEKAPDRTFAVTIDSPLINKYSQIYEDVIEVNDEDVKDEASLRKYGEQYFKTSLCDMMEDSLELEVVGQSDVPVQMYDIVSLFHEVYNLDVRKKITKYTYSPMANKLLSIGFGQFKSGLSNMVSNAVSDAVKSEAQQLQSDFERQLARELKNADLAFDRQKKELVNQFTDGLNAAKAKAEEVKRELSDTIDQRFSSFNNGPLQEAKRRAEEALRQSGASSLLAQEAKRIGLDSIAKLEEFKRQATSAQTALSGDLDVLKRTIANDIRPKQAQAETEIAKQVEALSQAKKELAGVKSAQATYEETTTRRLAELTNLANGKASKSELVQTADELVSRIASVSVGGVNLFKSSRDFSGSWVNVGQWTKETEKYKGLTVMSRTGSWLGLSQPFEAKKGETYTFSFYIKSSAERDQANIYFVHNSTSTQARVSLNVSSLVISNEWQRLSATFKIEESGFILPRIERFNADNRVYVAGLKLEHGTIATDYNENPEDVDGRVSAVESNFKQRADSLDAGVNRLTEGLRTKADISSLNVTAENIRQSVKSLETDTQNKLNQKLNLAEFEVRAGSIRQEILNATKDKADKTLVTAEAGKLREELASQIGSGRNLWINSKIAGNPVVEALPTGHITGQKQCYKLINNQELLFNIEPDFSSRLFRKVTFSAWVKYENVVRGANNWNAFNCFKHYMFLRNSQTGAISSASYLTMATLDGTSDWKRIVFTYDYSANKGYDQLKTLLKFNLESVRSGTAWITGVQVEFGAVANEYAPSPEDAENLITEAKATFERTAQGLRTDLSSIQEYVGQDGQRQEALRRYTREESAKQATAVRELVTRDYVGKATYQEDVRGIERRFDAITNTQNGSIATQIANYKNAVDGRFAEITSMISGKANQTDFQRVQETSRLYERILGNTNNSISDNVARMAMTNKLFQVEVSKYAGNGVNRALNTTSDWGPFISRSGTDGVNLHADLHKILSNGFKAGDTVHVRMEISIDDVQRFNDKQIVAILQSYGDVTNWSRAGRTFDYNIGTLQPGNNWRLIEFNTVMTEEMLKNNSWMLNLRVDGARSYKVHTKIVKIEKGNIASAWSPAPEDTEEAVRTVQSQLAGSWGVHNKNSVNEIIAGFNLAGRNAGIKAETIRLEGRTLLDEMTAIQGYFKRLFVGEGTFATLNTDILRANSITADKLVMDMAMARRFVSSDIFTDTLAAKEAFINKLRSVVVTATLLEGYKGRIGGFQIGTHEKDSSVYWITGQNQFSVGMSNGSGQWSQTALWVNWGNNWAYPGDYAWYVKNNGKMYCYNTAEFWNTPVIHGDLRVTGHIYYNNENSGKSGYWIHSSKYSNFEPSDNYLYLYYSGSGYDWIPMNKEISDRRYKSNIQDSKVSGLDVIERLKTYRYRKEYDGKIEDIACGIMAQDVQKYIPEAFYENPDGAYSYRTFELVPYLIKAIQELNQKIEKLEKTA